jgi:predicted pyridoxine 5'-phosphate oxidase superfamily flavin-nucleotide-binding protein
MAGFHAGELAVQRRAGVEDAAARLTGMLAPAELRGGLGLFLSGRTYAAMSARDRAGRLWVSPLAGEPGFLAVTGPTTLEIGAAPGPGDPLHYLAAGQAVGLLVIEYVARRRARINGRLVSADAGRLVIEASEAYGNCPQYIPPRPLHLSAASSDDPHEVRPELTEADARVVSSVDTAVLGTTHPERGNDASHRGGPAGFLRVESGRRLVWDDLPGNKMFNSLGNLAVDPAAALLVVDRAAGARVRPGRGALGGVGFRDRAPGRPRGRGRRQPLKTSVPTADRPRGWRR